MYMYNAQEQEHANGTRASKQAGKQANISRVKKETCTRAIDSVHTCSKHSSKHAYTQHTCNAHTHVRGPVYPASPAFQFLLSRPNLLICTSISSIYIFLYPYPRASLRPCIHPYPREGRRSAECGYGVRGMGKCIGYKRAKDTATSLDRYYAIELSIRKGNKRDVGADVDVDVDVTSEVRREY